MTKEYTKIRFPLEQDEDGYPPAASEYVWSINIGKNAYKIENIPFYIRGISYGDIVSVKNNADELEYDRLINESGHSTIRIIFYDKDISVDVLADLEKMGCTWEGSHLKNLMAVDIPPKVILSNIREYLNKLEDKGKLGYEESCIAHVI